MIPLYIYRISSTEPAMLHHRVSTVAQNGQTAVETTSFNVMIIITILLVSHDL